MAPVPIPRDGFLATQQRLTGRVPARWRSADGERLWEWDSLHGHIEGYNRRGRHVGVFDAVTGQRIAEAVKGRRIDV